MDRASMTQRNPSAISELSNNTRRATVNNLQDDAKRKILLSRQKKEAVIKDIKQRQSEFLYKNQFAQIQPSINQSQTKIRILEDQSDQSCCFGLFSLRTKEPAVRSETIMKDNEIKMPQNVMMTGPKSLSKERFSSVHVLARKAQQPQQMHSDEWWKYLLKNLKNMKGLEWADDLIRFIKEKQTKFKSTKFRGHIYNLNYSKHQLSSMIPLRSRLQSVNRQGSLQSDSFNNKSFYDTKLRGRLQSTIDLPVRNELLDMRLQSSNSGQSGDTLAKFKSQVVIRNQDLNDGAKKETSAEDPMADIYQQNTYDYSIPQLNPDTHRYLYGFSPDNEKEMTTLDQMNESTTQLFNILKSQMQEPEHPLNEMTQAFINSYTQHYTNQIMQSQGRQDFYMLTEVNQDFEITFIDKKDKKVLENYQMEHGASSLQFQTFDTDLLRTSTLMKPTFMQKNRELQSLSSKAIQQQQYKLAEAAIGEVKQFLCIMYGGCVRFYNTVIKYEVLEQMKEDLIEVLTSLVFNSKLAKLLMVFSRVCTHNQEEELTEKLITFKRLKPKDIDISQYFTLDKTSKIEQIFLEQQAGKTEGDIGGSTGNSGHIQGCRAAQQYKGPETKLGNIDPSINPSFYSSLSLNDESNRRSTSPRLSATSNLQHQSMKPPSTLNILISPDTEEGLQEELKEDEFQMHNDSMIRRWTSMQPQIKEEEEQESGSDSSSCCSNNSDCSLHNPINRYNIRKTKNRKNKINITLQEIKEKLKVKPYLDAIAQMRNLKDCDTPIDKMKCIAKVSKKIVACINKFWKGLKIKKDKLVIDGDSLLMIYIYIAVKAKMPDLFAQIKIMNEFSTPFVRTTKLGYCLSTLEVALNHILHLTQEDLEYDNSRCGSMWSQKQRSMSGSITHSVYMSAQSMSLRVPDDPFEEYFGHIDD